jgi:HTH-type transcriptional regulator/antitoxin HigA
MNLQSKYDELNARIASEAALSLQVPIFENFKDCYKDLVSSNYCPNVRKVEEKIQALLDFFQVVSLDSINKLPQAHFRKSTKVHVSNESVAAWLRVGEKEAEKIEVAPFDSDKIIKFLPELRMQTRSPEGLGVFLNKK